MKKMLMILLVFLGGVSNLMAQADAANGAKIEFEKEIHDFGTLEYGGDASCTFVFKNTGNEPLIISEAKRSCGCTVPSFSKEPILPGETGEIKVVYDSKRPGAINKSVTVTSNASNAPTKVIRIKGTIKPQTQSGAPVNKTLPAVNN